MSKIINPRLFYAFALLALIAASAPAPLVGQRCSTCLTIPPAGSLDSDASLDRPRTLDSTSDAAFFEATHPIR